MAKSKKEKKTNVQLVRKFLEAQPDATPEEIAAGVRLTSRQVYAIRHQLKAADKKADKKSRKVRPSKREKVMDVELDVEETCDEIIGVNEKTGDVEMVLMEDAALESLRRDVNTIICMGMDRAQMILNLLRR